MKEYYHFSTIIISNSQIETLVSLSKSTNVNGNMSFPNSTFEGNFSTYVFDNHFDVIEGWKFIFGLRDIYYAKKYEILSYVWSLEFL